MQSPNQWMHALDLCIPCTLVIFLAMMLQLAQWLQSMLLLGWACLSTTAILQVSFCFCRGQNGMLNSHIIGTINPEYFKSLMVVLIWSVLLECNLSFNFVSEVFHLTFPTIKLIPKGQRNNIVATQIARYIHSKFILRVWENDHRASPWNKWAYWDGL